MDKFTNLAIISLLDYKTTGDIDHLTKAQQIVSMIHKEVKNPDETWRREAM